MTSACAAGPRLDELERQAHDADLLLRLKVGRPLGLWSLHLVVAQQSQNGSLRWLGNMKAWAYPAASGLQLDTMRVMPSAPAGVGDLIWSATMAWTLEMTPCRTARLLAIRDDERQHQRLLRYFRCFGFEAVRSVDAALWDLPLRLVWGGAGMLMTGDCARVQTISQRRWRQSAA
jgi:hypothetical protein